MDTTANAPLQVTIYPSGYGPPAPAAATPATQGFWSGEGPSFKDVLDIINPLQHIPIISSIYQSMTGETQSTASKFVGGALFGGPLGFASALLGTIFESATGSSLESNVMAAVEGNPVPALHTGATDVAQNDEPCFLCASQRASYNAYVRTQSMMSPAAA